MTSALEDAVGVIVKNLEGEGLVKNTLVVFLNDNGGPGYTKVQSNGPPAPRQTIPLSREAFGFP